MDILEKILNMSIHKNLKTNKDNKEILINLYHDKRWIYKK